MVTELKTFWTWNFEFILARPLNNLHLAEAHLAQLVIQMRDCRVQYDILSTYNATAYSDITFSLGEAYLRTAAGDNRRPSAKQCVLGIAILANSANPYMESPIFSRKSDTPGTSAPATSSRALPYSVPIKNHTVFFSEKENATDSVAVTKIIKWLTTNEFFQGEGVGGQWVEKTKAIFEGIWHDKEVIIKCWDYFKMSEIGLELISLYSLLKPANKVLATGMNAPST
ncbi:hypothetical protein N7495_004236 [Penicillium taxi]|uniref:uncharacterized protein n=1 Tax=Penicillium taxi TaxID=168475 RepID=UPI0025450CC7|nr:uncharacterized protein N7495_004236 [Penicillium taxi]KAJ5899492.1 hypothetical protein N7495_004236 [Penicillium taxi]